MISILHLLWIVPLAGSFGALVAAVLLCDDSGDDTEGSWHDIHIEGEDDVSDD